jgi:hypothetical protein
MAESSRVLAEENATLKARLVEAAGERDALRVSSEQERARLRETLDKVTEQLGEAAKKPSPPAYATATASSEGRNEATAPPASATAPVTVVGPASPPAAPARAPAARPRPAALCAPDGKAPPARGAQGSDAVACAPSSAAPVTTDALRDAAAAVRRSP